MSLSERNKRYLDVMKLVEGVSRSLRATSWVLGGFVPDIYMGQILREHDDLDYLTLNLRRQKVRLEGAFLACGWQVKGLANGDLKLEKDDIKVQLGNVELGEVARWTHNGEKGSLLFPVSWLSVDVIEFYGMEVHVVAPELQYVLKEHPELLNPGWLIREKDTLDRKCLQDMLAKRGIDVSLLHKSVVSI